MSSEELFVVADCQIPTAELLRLDEPAECCAILPSAQGGPWGEYWRHHCTRSPTPPMPSGFNGDEYSFAVRPLTRDLAARYRWSWTMERRYMKVPARSVHEELGFPQPYIISPRWWTDVLATLPWQAAANFDLGDLAAGMYRIFLLPRCEADGGARAIVVADMRLVKAARRSASGGSDAARRRKKRLKLFFEHSKRLPPLGEWRSSSELAPAVATGGGGPDSASDALRGWASKAHSFGFGSTRYWCVLRHEPPAALCCWRSEEEAALAPPKESLLLEGAAVEEGGGGRLKLQLRDGRRATLDLGGAAQREPWLAEVREATAAAPPRLARLASSGRLEETPGEPGGDVAAGGLFPHQLRTVAWMEAVEAEEWLPQGLRFHATGQLPRGGLVAHPPGAGKTRCVCELLRRRAGRAEGATVVFAPAHLAQQWRAELDAHAGSAAATTTVLSFDGHGSGGQSWPSMAGVCRVIVDEPQDARGTEWARGFGAARRGVRAPYVWALCGTAAEHVEEIAALLLGDGAPRGDEARAMAAALLVHRRALRDPPSRCLPAPPLRVQEVPVALSADEASASQLALLSGHLMDALLLIAFGRSAAFAAAPERAALLHGPRQPLGRGGGGGGGGGGGVAGVGGGGGEPLRLESWAGALEADVTRRHGAAQAELAETEAEAARQRAAFVARGGVVAPPRPSPGGGVLGGMLQQQRDAAPAGAELPPEWVREVVDNAVETAGVEPALAARLGVLRRAVAECERALRFSAAMKELVASPTSECPVCLDTYEVAAVLPCLHATCRTCMTTHAAAASSFRCPLCREAVARAEVVTLTKVVATPVVLGVPVSQPLAVPLVAAVGAVRQLSRQLSGSFEAASAAVQGVVRQLSGSTPAAPAAPAEAEALPVQTLLEALPLPGERELPDASSRVRVLVGLLRALLAQGADERVLIFAQWAAHVTYLAGVLRTAGVAHLTLGNSLPESMAALQAFGRPEQPRVLLMSSQKHAAGINLQCARHVVIIHPHCTPTARSARQLSLAELASYERQAIGRARRFPQTRQVEVYRFVAPGTVEEEVYTGRIQQA